MSCLGALEPDLIILDEFQRFKHLLDGTDESSGLAQELFTFRDARVLLLSATPYKMYTVSDEAEGDDHFKDFLQTVRFLQSDEAKTSQFESLLGQYRTELFRLGAGEGDGLKRSKKSLRETLRAVMVRTERLAVTADRNGMLAEVSSARPKVRPEDFDSYVALARVARAVEHPDVLEYWKSAPYLLNFMDDYQFKAAFRDALGVPDRARGVMEALAASPDALLDWKEVEAYRRLDPGNARLRALADDVVGSGAWQLCWLPPALPYYELGSPFDAVKPGNLTKRLVFSSWQVVPKVVAALLSYEAERLMFGEASEGDERPNTPEAREKRRPLLRFSRSEGRLTGMPVLGLLYPSPTLAAAGDPLSLARRLVADGRLPTAAEVLREVATDLERRFGELPVETASSGPPDERWYWAAPVLLDLQTYPDATRKWLGQERLAEQWRGDPDEAAQDEEDGPHDEEDAGAWSAHVDELRRLASGAIALGPRPPDLSAVLAKIAVGAPAVVALRALSRISGGPDTVSLVPLRNKAGWVAWAFRGLFNLPEVTAFIRRLNPEEPYWLRVAEYCVAGCLQAVLDEYAHVLLEWEGVRHRPVREAAREVARRMSRVLRLRTANVRVDVINLDSAAGAVTIDDKKGMRTRFAARFGVRQSDEAAGALRQDDVRGAFNSPFWPFVLCSTSVGQEGLDFHLYCHAVVHWNLPSNPVDLEQREGRVHRFKGHAVRKNVARRYAAEALAADHPDPWEYLFEAASRDRDADHSELVPYWVFAVDGGARIERHIPAFPLSRDFEQAERLRRALTIYRMAFGQNRQEDVVAYLRDCVPPDEIERMAQELRVDLSPPKAPPLRIGQEDDARLAQRGTWEDEHEAKLTITGRVAPVLTFGAARDLLDRFRDLRAARQNESPYERYRDLLESFASLKSTTRASR